jgi:hypothetical protein
MASQFYKSPHLPCPSFREIDVPVVLHLAINNGMCQRIAEKLMINYLNELNEDILMLANTLIESYKSRFTRVLHVLEMLKHELSDFFLLKTYFKDLAEAADVDLLVPDLKEAVRILNDSGFKLLEQSNQKAMFSFDGVAVHLHGKITWADEKSSFIDDELIWDDPRALALGNAEFRCPSINVDALLCLAHISFETFRISLRDMLYLYSLGGNLIWSEAIEQAEKHRWGRTLKRSMVLLDILHHTFYSNPCPFQELDFLRHVKIDYCPRKIVFPLLLPRTQLIVAFWQKGLTRWVLSNRMRESLHTVLFKAK